MRVRSIPRPRRKLIVGLVLGAAVAPLITGAPGASAAPRVVTNSVTTNASMASGVTAHRTVERDVTDGTTTTVIDKRNVSFTVSQTSDLRSLQQISMSWSGAHPTGGITTDPNSDFAQNQEYSFLVMECRGMDSASVPASQQLSPETCWTQFADERFAYGYDPYPAWRSDMYAAPSDRAAIARATASATSASCAPILIGTATQRWLPFVSVAGATFDGGPFGCAGQAPEAAPANLSSLALPSNETFGVTGLDGTGSANFTVFTGEDHASLGCSQTVACSLVAIPIMGISCDSTGALSKGNSQPSADDLAGAKSNCETNGNWKPGQLLPSGFGSGAAAVDGSLWWSASNWRNRISVPLTFAPSDNACSLFTSLKPRQVYGSELLIQASTSWSPHFCLQDKSFNFQHIHTPEPQARNLLSTGNIEAAFTSEPPDTPYPIPVVNAPVAMSGFGIAFDIDDKTHHRMTSLNLNARLIAKLLTESYPDQTFVRDPYPVDSNGTATLSKNPINLSQDPEFQALNPTVPISNIDSASTLLALSSDSDVMYALTSYLNADPEARAFLDGTPDPWGMRVNPNYRKIALPVNNWPVLDTFVPTDEYQIGRIDCLVGDNAPFLPLVASPTAALFNIGQDMQFALSQSQTVCSLPSPIPGDLTGAKMVAQGREAPGRQFMLGIVSLGDAAREGLSLASLQTQSTASTTAPFTDGTGRTFVAPTPASMKAAAVALKPDATTGTWPVPYSALRTDKANLGAYPGTMPVYLAVPTKGLPTSDASDFAKLLTYLVGAGQTAGTAQGQLPDGYLPLTSANGLSELAAYSGRAAVAIAAQHGDLPSLTTSGTPTTPAPNPVSPAPFSGGSGGTSGSASGSGTSGGASAPTGASGGTLGTGKAQAGAGKASKAAPASPSTTINAAPAAVITPVYRAGLGSIVLPGVLIVMLLAGAAAGVMTIRNRGIL